MRGLGPVELGEALQVLEVPLVPLALQGRLRANVEQEGAERPRLERADQPRRKAALAAPEMAQEVLSQSKRPEVGRFLLQVDRQTKQSYATAEAAEMAGMVIKKGHPIVRVSVYDSVETANKIIELPAGSSPKS